jgi:hypothetical protein
MDSKKRSRALRRQWRHVPWLGSILVYMLPKSACLPPKFGRDFHA